MLRRRCVVARAECYALLAAILLALPGQSAHGQVEIPPADPNHHIVASGKHAHHWTEGGYEVWWLEGDCHIDQGPLHAKGNEALVWVERSDRGDGTPHNVIAYLEGKVVVERTPSSGSNNAHGTRPGGRDGGGGVMALSGTGISNAATLADGPSGRLEDTHWLGRLTSNWDPEIKIASAEGEPSTKPAVYTHGTARLAQADKVQQAQFQTAVAPEELPPAGSRRIRYSPRSGVPLQIQTVPSANPNETIIAINSGVNILIDGLQNVRLPVAFSGSIDLEADRMVIWTSGAQLPNLSGDTVEPADRQFEVYMEGNVVVREGDRVVQAQAMYYNVTQRVGTILDAELLTPVPRLQGLLRIKADVLRQISRDQYVADEASVTTSRIGIPSYRFRSGTLTLTDEQVPILNPFTGQPQIDPVTLQPATEHEQLVTGENNVFLIDEFPVFYWPFFAADLEKPPLYFHNIQYRHDSVFGHQALFDLNPYTILGIRHPPKGTQWDISLDYLSFRGFGGGTMFRYDREGFFDWPGRYNGFIDAWYIDDHGVDNLGLDRRAITFPQAFRGRTLFRHQQELPSDWQLQLEVGEVTDRNFLMEYYQHEWDEQKDQVTRLGLRRIWDNMSLELAVSGQLDPFFTQTQDLPKLDHFWLGQPLLNDTLTWYEHSNIGYLNQNKVTAPTDPTDLSQFHFLPYDVSAQGFRAATRNEFDWPFQVGAVKIVPYALGEYAHWGEDINGENLDRVYGQFGVRSSLPIWSVDPTVESTLWNVHGIAHKVVFEGQFLFADANRNLDQLAIYDAIDDNNIQAMRRRLGFEDYGTLIPPPLPFQVPLKYDERFYAVRRDTMGWVTGPTEIADDLTQIRLAIDQRWQTKRGIPGQQHVIDWIKLDAEMEIFPESNQNFGSAAGLFDYDFQWFVGDRLTLLSFGGFDFFGGGQRWATAGGYLTRPPRGSLYLGFNTFEGPFTSNVITTSYTYRMTPKWLSSMGVSYDLNKQGNIGENIRLTRVGDSFLMTLGLSVDASRNNVGFTVSVIPRFLGRSQSVTRGTVDLPPAGLFGLE